MEKGRRKERYQEREKDKILYIDKDRERKKRKDSYQKNVQSN